MLNIFEQNEVIPEWNGSWVSQKVHCCLLILWYSKCSLKSFHFGQDRERNILRIIERSEHILCAMSVHNLGRAREEKKSRWARRELHLRHSKITQKKFKLYKVWVFSPFSQSCLEFKMAQNTVDSFSKYSIHPETFRVTMRRLKNWQNFDNF